MKMRGSHIVLLVACGFCLLAAVASEKKEQPVQFNHKVHISDLGMECADCHQYVLQSRKATLPGKQICMQCHEEPQGETSEEQKLVALLKSDQDLEWKRIYVLPKHVYFSHFRHVTLGQIACAACHGEMKVLTQPPTKPAVDIINMNHCIDCHEDKNVDIDCLTCHN